MNPPKFCQMIDLLSARLGGHALIANDEFFAPKENLLKPSKAEFIPDKYTDHGKWMDGWESRRRREPGHDWCILKMGVPGQLHGFNIDTSHFLGNHPAMASVEACEAPAKATRKDLSRVAWDTIVPQGSLRRGSQNLFAAKSSKRYTHVRLNIFPDGGVARLRVQGEVKPDWTALVEVGEPLDLVSAQLGGRPLAASDRFFSEPLNLLMPGRAENMGDGWETARRRTPSRSERGRPASRCSSRRADSTCSTASPTPCRSSTPRP